MNCIGVSGDPFVEGGVLRERGLCAVGVIKANVGKNGKMGSGVRGGTGEPASCASSRVAELIHFVSGIPALGGESGKILKLSAKWFLMNLCGANVSKSGKKKKHVLEPTLIVLPNRHRLEP
jgi:hypothetical protein